MGDIARIIHFEKTHLNRDRLDALVAELGDADAERVIGQAMEELAVRLNRIEAAYRAGETARIAKGAQGLVAIADQVGMSQLSAIAHSVTETIADGNTAAIAATVARLVRIGESSLMTVWDVKDMSV